MAYAGSVVLLVGVGFLYGTEYTALGSGGRLALIGLIVLGSIAAGELVRRAGATEAARRARAAGWAVGALGVAAWFAQAFPLVLFASGVTLLAVAAGLFRFLPLLAPRDRSRAGSKATSGNEVP